MYGKKWIVAFGVIFFGIAAINAAAQTETWQIDPAHSAAQFSVRHMGISTVRGQFQKVTGTANYDPKDVSKTSLDATIETSSIDTRVEMRDNDLKGTNFFDVQQYPTITFKSKETEADGEGKLKIRGDLTMHGVTKEVVLDVDGPTPAVKDPRGNFQLAFPGGFGFLGFKSDGGIFLDVKEI